MSLRLISAAPAFTGTVPSSRTMPAVMPPLLPSAAADRLALPGALAVTTGQQPGLFGGPMYVVHKALAARALAQELERRWHRPVVPVFWLAGDDHDHEEATHTAWWNGDDEVVRWSLPPRPRDAPQRPMSAEPLGPGLAEARARLAADLPAGPARDATLAWVDRHWVGTATVHSAFTGAMHELLSPLGIATLDATSPGLKRAARPLIRAALDRSVAIDEALASLPEADARADAGQGLTLVFLEATAGRDRLVRDGDGFRTRRGGERFTASEIARLLDEAPERFSANVLLRPVVESALLPTVAYVAGPGEYRYLTSQARVVYPLLDTPVQRPVPRWSGTVADPVSERLLGRLELGPDDVLHDDGRVARRLLQEDLPASVRDALTGLRSAINHASAVSAEVGAGIDPVLGRAVESRQRRLRFVADDLEGVMLRHLRKRDAVRWRQYQRLRARLRPLDAPQERVIGVAGALGRWGEEWIAAATAATEAWAAALLPTADVVESHA